MSNNTSPRMRRRPRLQHVLLALLILVVALPVLAMPPDERDIHALDVLNESPDRDSDVVATPPYLPLYDSQGAGLQVQPQWVPSGSKPGFYAVRDWRNLDATTHGFVGSHENFFWDQLEPTEGVYRWEIIDNFLNTAIASGKQGAFGIITFNGRDSEGEDNDPPLRTPAWVFAAGAQKVQCEGRGSEYPVGDPRHTAPPPFEIPAYWDSIYQAKYRDFIAAMASRFDGDPRIEFIQIGVGKYGETQPCDDNKPGDYMDDDCVLAAWKSVYPEASKYSWAYTVVDIVDIYADNFRSTKLLLPNAPTFFGDSGGRKEWTQDAINRGVGLFPAGLMAIQEWVDLRNHTSTGVRYTGIFDYPLQHIEEFEAGIGPEQWVNSSGRPIALSQEAYHYMSPSAIEYYWAVLGALRRRMDYITVEHNLLYSGEGIPRSDFAGFVDVMKWASQYMGKHLADTPSVWVALREAGYKDSWYPQKGNYSWFLYQDDSISGGKTVATTYRTKQQLVHSWDWDAYGEAGTVRAEIETGQTFLGPSYEGWICRRTDGSSNPRMFFKIDDRYAYQGPGPTTITVTYFDQGTDSWRLVYDAVGNIEKAVTVTKTNSNWWKTYTFNISDGYFGNRQAGGADFFIDSMSDGDEYIHKVDVSRAGGSNTATPTATLDPNLTPSATPTPSRTPGVTPTATTVSFRGASQDTYINAGAPDTNYENGGLRVYGPGWKRSLLDFNVGAQIPGDAEIVSATLRLTAGTDDYGKGHLSLDIGAYLVYRNWIANQATWNVATSGVGWGSAGCDGVPSDHASSPASVVTVQEVSAGTNPNQVKTYDWDVTPIVQAWIDDPASTAGLILLAPPDSNYRDMGFFDSAYLSEEGAALHPLLIVQWRTGETTPTPTATLPPGQGAVSGTVYHDLNADGVRDVGELGLAGATVELWSGGTLARPPYVTLGSGGYSFTALAPGGYTVKLIPPAGYAASNLTQRAVTVSAGQTTMADWGVFEGDRRIHLPLIRK
jgi:hypothetical protein